MYAYSRLKLTLVADVQYTLEIFSKRKVCCTRFSACCVFIRRGNVKLISALYFTVLHFNQIFKAGSPIYEYSFILSVILHLLV